MLVYPLVVVAFCRIRHDSELDFPLLPGLHHATASEMGYACVSPNTQFYEF